VKLVPFFSGGYAIRVPFLSKMVSKTKKSKRFDFGVAPPRMGFC